MAPQSPLRWFWNIFLVRVLLRVGWLWILLRISLVIDFGTRIASVRLIGVIPSFVDSWHFIDNPCSSMIRIFVTKSFTSFWQSVSLYAFLISWIHWFVQDFRRVLALRPCFVTWFLLSNFLIRFVLIWTWNLCSSGLSLFCVRWAFRIAAVSVPNALGSLLLFYLCE